MKVLKIKTLCFILAVLFSGAEFANGQGLTMQHLTDNTEFFGKPKKKKKKKKKKKATKNKKTEKEKATEDATSTEENSEYFKDDSQPLKFKDRLWYGGGIGLGFGSNQFGSLFSFGLSPMVGYKIWGPFSAGPRLSGTLNSEKRAGFKAANLFDYEAGLFVRSKIFGPIFAHAEVGNQWRQYLLDYDFNTKKWTKGTDQRVNQYIGLGYNNGDGGPGFEILVLYNFRVARDENTYESPFNFRVGLTWRF